MISGQVFILDFPVLGLMNHVVKPVLGLMNHVVKPVLGLMEGGTWAVAWQPKTFVAQ
jgi:uncharacterized membrane protein YvlD (DUF360 family)